MAKILVVDDDVEFAKSVKKWLDFDEHSVDVVHNATDALSNLRGLDYDVLLLDWNLPDMTGLELCKTYRASGGSAAVMMLTAFSAIDSKVQGLDSGADDYLTKPFETKEMLARVRSLLRRPGSYAGAVLKAGDVVLNAKSRIVTKAGVEIPLKRLEFAVLEFFMRHPNEVVSTDTLIKRVWNSPAEASTDSVYTCIKRLRQKLSETDNESVIKTVHGVGYRFDPPAN